MKRLARSIRKTVQRKPEFRNRPKPGESADLLKTSADAFPTVVRVMGYGAGEFVELAGASTEEIWTLRQRFPVIWIDVNGLANLHVIQELAARFELHPLAVEDVVRTHQRAKVEDYANQLFMVARMPPLKGEDLSDQLSMFLGDGYVITFQERPGDDLDPVRNRIRTSRARLRRLGPDYLAYSILDSVIDAYFPLLEADGEMLEELENSLIEGPSPAVLEQVYAIRRRLLKLRRALWPLREMTANLLRDETPRIQPETRVYLRDCYDHTVQLIDLMEVYRETSSSLMDVYLSSMSNRLNEVMKVLTIITVIFIPLTFVAGVYGMNFDPDASRLNMPELRWRYGYVVCLGLMLIIAAAEIYYFRRKGWLGEGYERKQPPLS